jgi:PKD-like domain
MKKRMTFLFMTVFCLIHNMYGQVSKAHPCPAIILIGPKENKITEGKALSFHVKPFGKAYKNYSLTYSWTVSAGTIFSGQGTDTVYVDTQGLKGQKIIGTVEVGGMKPGCSNTKSITIQVAGEKPKPGTSKRKNNPGVAVR